MKTSTVHKGNVNSGQGYMLHSDSEYNKGYGKYYPKINVDTLLSTIETSKRNIECGKEKLAKKEDVFKILTYFEVIK